MRNAGGRRVGERRAVLLPTDDVPELPRRARRHAHLLTFAERVEPAGQEMEDGDTARLVIRFQSGEQAVFNDLYARYFSRVYGYLRVALKDGHEAEDVAQQIFLSVYENLPRYERRGAPFRAWLFTIARNEAVRSLRKLGRVETAEVGEIDEIRLEREASNGGEPSISALDWISDRDLMVFVERLPEAQRQVLALSFMLDLSDREIAAILGRTGPDVRTLRHRALRFLEARLRAVGRTPHQSARQPWRRRVRKAPVLRMRRHALSP